MSALNDDFEVWVDDQGDTASNQQAVKMAADAVAAHLGAHPPPHELVPCIHVEIYPAEGDRLLHHYGVVL